MEGGPKGKERGRSRKNKMTTYQKWRRTKMRHNKFDKKLKNLEKTQSGRKSVLENKFKNSATQSGTIVEVNIR